MECKTWKKDSNELVDYECNELLDSCIKTSYEGSLFRINDEIKFVNTNEVFPKSIKTKLLCNIDCNHTTFFLKRPSLEELRYGETPWLIIKELDQKNYKLSVGDVIKLGRVKLRITEIKLNKEENIDINGSKYFATKYENENIRGSNIMGDINKNNVQVKNEFLPKLSEMNKKESSHKKKNTCRICYCNDNEVESPLLIPCKCAGTMKYIHFSCLETWLKSKSVLKSNENEICSSYNLKQIECELCKALLPDYVKYKDKLYDLREFMKPKFKSYLTLESVVDDKNVDRSIFHLNLDVKQTLRLGRGHESDIRISDISVSRYHAIINKNIDGSLTLEDNNSKFGTLIMLQNPRINILEKISLPLQIGRTILQLKIKKPWNFFACCSSTPKEEFKDYQSLNSNLINTEEHALIKFQEDVSIQEEYSEINNARDSENNKLKRNIEHVNSPSIKLSENIIFINNDNSSYNQFINIKKEELVDNLESNRNNNSNIETRKKIGVGMEIEEIHINNENSSNNDITVRNQEFFLPKNRFNYLNFIRANGGFVNINVSITTKNINSVEKRNKNLESNLSSY